MYNRNVRIRQVRNRKRPRCSLITTSDIQMQLSNATNDPTRAALCKTLYTIVQRCNDGGEIG